MCWSSSWSRYRFRPRLVDPRSYRRLLLLSFSTVSQRIPASSSSLGVQTSHPAPLSLTDLPPRLSSPFAAHTNDATRRSSTLQTTPTLSNRASPSPLAQGGGASFSCLALPRLSDPCCGVRRAMTPSNHLQAYRLGLLPLPLARHPSLLRAWRSINKRVWERVKGGGWSRDGGRCLCGKRRGRGRRSERGMRWSRWEGALRLFRSGEEEEVCGLER